MEYCVLDFVVNLYLVYVFMLVVGFKGIEEGYEFLFEVEDNVWVFSDVECCVLGYLVLFVSFDYVLEYMEELEFVVEMFGE